MPGGEISEELTQLGNTARRVIILLQEPQQLIDKEASARYGSRGMLPVLAVEKPFAGCIFELGDGESVVVGCVFGRL
jgi:hypothetical protein